MKQSSSMADIILGPVYDQNTQYWIKFLKLNLQS